MTATVGDVFHGANAGEQNDVDVCPQNDVLMIRDNRARVTAGWSPPTETRFVMHVLIVEFELQGVGRSEYEGFCDQLAPAFARLPGLIAKVWIIDAESNRAGGIYTWIDRAACDAYLAGELFTAARAEPTLVNLRYRRFGVLERPTEITRGLPVGATA